MMRGSFQAKSAAELLPFLFETLPEVKRTKVRQWLKFDGVRVNGRLIHRGDHPLLPGDVVLLDPQSRPEPGPRLPAGMRIVHEDPALIVIEKPANLLSIATKAEQEATAYAKLTDWVRQRERGRGARIWIVHRLDRETSGLMVFARTESAKRLLQEQWGEAEKRYLAVVDGTLPAATGTLRSHLDETNPFRVRSTRPSEVTREAVTHYRVVQQAGARSLVELTLETGRRHQIRVQLAEVRCPVVGDPKYHPSGVEDERLALHSAALKFRHPQTGETLSFESPLPNDLERLLNQRSRTKK
jgi:23S rRNA pseudouridine1911/1915/1917 synthase